MIFKWFNIFNLADWNETGLTSRTKSVFLEGIGEKSVLICQGVQTCILVDDVFLPLNFEGKNPWVSSGYGVYVDTEQNVWLGFEVSE